VYVGRRREGDGSRGSARFGGGAGSATRPRRRSFSGDDGERDVEAGDGLAGDDVAQQRCRRAVVDVDFHHRAGQSRVAVEDDDAVAVGAAHE